MKKLLVSLFIVIASFNLYSEDQKVYSITRYRDLYTQLETLQLELRLSPLSTAYPFTESEINNILSAIDYNSLSENSKKLYNSINSKLVKNKKNGFTGYFSGEVNIETYLQTNKENQEWIYDYKSRQPLLELDFAFGISNHFWADIAIPLQKSRNFYNYTPYPLEDFSRFSSGAESNLSILWDQSHLDAQFPFLAVSSLGGKNWNILFGRDTLNYGVGKSGSFVLSEDGIYHDMLKASTFWDKFKYTFTLVNIDPMDLDGLDPYIEYEQTTNIDDETITVETDNSRRELKILINHTLEFKPFNNLSLALHEATIRGGGEVYLGYLNPLMIIHNLALPDRRDTIYGNSIFVFSAIYTPFKRFSIYGEYCLDQFETASEAERQGDQAGKGDPNAFGFLTGFNYLHNFNNFSVNLNGEFALTNPHLYRSENSWSVYALTLYYHSVYNDNNDRMVEPLGYKEGPDTMLFKVSLDTSLFERKLDLKLEYYNIQKGVERIYNRADQGAEASKQITKSGDTIFEKNIISLTGNYRFNDTVSFYSQLNGLFFKNVDNLDGKDIIDYQFVFGSKFKF